MGTRTTPLLATRLKGKMRCIRRRYLLFAGIISVLIFVTAIRSGFTGHQHITGYQRWLSSALSDELDTTETAKEVMWNATKTNEASKHGLYTVVDATPHKQTLLPNNSSLYVTAHNFKQGRLGNQMFRYASVLGIARKQGRQVFFDPDTTVGKTFKLQHVAIKDGASQWPVTRENNPYSFDDKLMKLPLKNLRIAGYLQSYLYFADIVDEVRQEFTFHDSIANDAANILHNVHLKYNSSIIVGVHVRRGDFLRERHIVAGYGVADKSYFEKAFRLMKSKFPDRKLIFLVASDDLRWCSKNLLGDDVYVLPRASSFVHLAVLSKCDHMIISGGSYGWWSGWIANGYVIYYTGFMAKGTRLGDLLNQSQYYPPMWTGLGN